MTEFGIFVVITLALVGIGSGVWRLIRGPAKQRSGSAFRVVVLSLTCAALVSVSAWRISKSRTFQCFGGIVQRVDTSAPVVALTFDDGPSSQFTEEVLAILREHDVRATFFVTGRALEENEAAAHRIVEEGHELGNHTYSHQRMVLKSYAFIQREIERTDQLIREVGYEGDIHFRSPYGKKLIALPYYLDQTGRLNIFFDVEPESYPEVAADADRIVEHALGKVRPGSIVLLHVMHESRVESRRALPGIIQGLQEQGYDFVTVSELLALSPGSAMVVMEEERTIK
ncbi:MAG: polysaccharide deacetylase family protein [Chloroflexota bacterium]|nr:polysaccharide deacetylase family protein [Chloroflexota bacterium]